MEELIYNLTKEERNNELNKLINKFTVSYSDKPRKTKWKDKEFVEKVIKQHIKYLTVERNEGIEDDESLITEYDAFRYLNLFNTKKRPNFEKMKEILSELDKEQTIGKEKANKILKGFGRIVESKKDKLLLQIKIINNFNYMNEIINSPTKFSLSPEYLYARLAYYKDINGDISSIPACEVLGDKDKYTEGNKKRITPERKEELIRQYALPNFNDENNKGER